MKCPNCDYKDGWDSESLSTCNGIKGEFYEVAGGLYAQREKEYGGVDKRQVYACPSCMIVFIEQY